MFIFKNIGNAVFHFQFSVFSLLDSIMFHSSERKGPDMHATGYKMPSLTIPDLNVTETIFLLRDYLRCYKGYPF